MSPHIPRQAVLMQQDGDGLRSEIGKRNVLIAPVRIFASPAVFHDEKGVAVLVFCVTDDVHEVVVGGREVIEARLAGSGGDGGLGDLAGGLF